MAAAHRTARSAVTERSVATITSLTGAPGSVAPLPIEASCQVRRGGPSHRGAVHRFRGFAQNEAHFERTLARGPPPSRTTRPAPCAAAPRRPYASFLVARDDAPPRRRRRPIRRVERALIGGVMAVIAFFVERLVVRSLKRSGSSADAGG